MNITPIGATFIVRKCTTGEGTGGNYHVGGIAIPDQRADKSNWAEIVKVGSKCKIVTNDAIGGVVPLPEWKPEYMRRIGDTDDFVVRERIYTDINPRTNQPHAVAAIWKD